MGILSALLAGLAPGIGLILSGLTNPAKVPAFLDLAGAWDPSLPFVMGGALLVAAPAHAIGMRRKRPLTDAPLNLPTASRIDRRLVFGSPAFGAGWGVAGDCPGPAVASLALGGCKPLLFFGAMLAGMALHELIERRKT